MLILSLLAPSALAQDIGTCEEFEAVDAPAVAVDEACQSEPRVGSFNPVVEWQWTSSLNYPGYEDIMTPPMVANLSDDNGDGLINADDVPDIAVVAHARNGWASYGVLMVLSGDGSGELGSFADIGGYRFIGGAGVAIGDLEGDGSPDICVGGYDAGVICAEADGSYKWHAGTRVSYGAAHPVIGDMDGDGCAEVAVGAQVFDCAGNLVFSGSSGDSDVGIGAVTAMADMDLDGELELVAGNAVYERDGSALWVDGGAEGYPAVGDFDGDGLPEVVRTGSGYVTLTDDDGSILWSVALTGGGRGGPPTVADF
ncbi:MAG: hypothetical protein H6741_21555, partial [Alphaproteobacteria bacterium]|nr:hypothetical protein [Alphaproteobacteria bacterium]